MSDPLDQPPLLPPPPRRAAPEELRMRLHTELRRAERRSRAPRLVIALVAAVTLIVATGVVITSLSSFRVAVPVATPNATPIATAGGPTPSTSDSSSASASEPPKTRALKAMTEDEIAADLKSCTKPEPGATDLPRRGTYRAILAVHIPLLTVPATDDTVDRRLMYAQDGAGTHTCIDGSSSSWSLTGRPEDPELTKELPAALFDSFANEQSCSTTGRDGRLDLARVWKVTERVEAARLTVRVAGQPARVVDLGPAAGVIAVGLEITGPASWEDTTWSVQFLDADERPLKVETERVSGKVVSTADTDKVRTCTEIMKERTLSRQPEPRPASDAAGVESCRRAIKEYVSTQDEGFDSADAVVALTISTDQTWGVVLRDGNRYVGCSRYPTQEISGIREDGESVSKKAFYWAVNPIPDGGQTLWAAGRTDGVEAITYQLPDGQRVAARIGKDGYWMLMATTTEAFDTEENWDDWSPVVVTAVVNGRTSTFSIPWAGTTSCNQVSHGC